MIELTVKTLDSQNHHFSVEDDITVEQFKEKIAETVNIPADTQRIIYCGRVLQDSSKLADYDVHGKVVHLVQRAPPGSNPRPSSRSASPQPQRRTFRPFRGMEQGNPMYLASMAFPGNLMESQGIVPPPPTHSLSGSRLIVARRMLRRAEAVLQLLENPNARPQEQAATEDNQEEEVTPVIEARVLVPNQEGSLYNEIMNVVHNTGLDPTTRDNISSSGQNLVGPLRIDPDLMDSIINDLSDEPAPENTLPENASRTSEMAELLTMLGQIQTRFAPFLTRYYTFMEEDPEVPTEDQRQTQTMLNRVSEVLHLLGHAYHSLSDIIIRVRTPPPRPLLCRPILIQHSAVVQTGIPIQVEVSSQINLSSDRQTPSTSNQPTTTTTTTSSSSSASESTSASATTTSTSSTTAADTQPSVNAGASISIQPDLVGIPLPAAMRINRLPADLLRVIRTPLVPPRAQNNNNNTVTTEAASGSSSATANTPPPSAPPPTASGGTPLSSQEGGQNGAFNFNNPNVEFFMEVSPEVIRGALTGPPPEFLQSLMQMAGQIINRNMQPATTTAAPASAPSSTSADTTSTTGAQASATAAGQNSQARGDTQTNPTTATHTRSTPRPHVHLAQQAMQGGFDPFLPCNSHHISRRSTRLQATQTAAAANLLSSQRGGGSRTAGESAGNPPNPSQNNATSFPTPRPEAGVIRAPGNNQNIINFVSGFFESVRRQTDSGPSRTPWTRIGVSENSVPRVPSLERGSIISTILNNLGQRGVGPEQLGYGTPFEMFIRRLQQDSSYVPGTSILGDLRMLFARNLTMVDRLAMSTGNTEPLARHAQEINNFVRNRLCTTEGSQEGIERAVNVLMTEFRPFLDTFRTMPLRADIDLVRSLDQLLRQRLPHILTICTHLSQHNMSGLITQCIKVVRYFLGLLIYASRCTNSEQGLEGLVDFILNSLVQNHPQGAAAFPAASTRTQIRQFLNCVSDYDVEQYVIRPTEVQALPPVIQNGQDDTVEDMSEPEPCEAAQNDVDMELDEQEASGSSNLGSPMLVLDDTEQLSNIVLGSEPWHEQLPEGWVPIITRDAQRQRRQNTQGPFSDAYLSGMPSKRRKLISNSKPQDSLPQVISDSVRQAVTATGLAGVAPLDTVVEQAGASPEIVAAYRTQLRSTVQASLQDNEDFVPERFPNVANYFKKDQ